MLGIEKSVRAMYGEGYDEETINKFSGGGIGVALFALFLAAVALMLAAALYFQDNGGKARMAADAAQAQVRAMEIRLRVLESQNGNVQGLLVNSMLNEIKQKAAFLSSQQLTPAQKAALAEALAPLAPPAPAPAAAPAAEAKPAPAPEAPAK